ncbi:hypothetical protein SAMN05660464_1417 [Geodermatophilus dictyosporus]|uniref:Uncharacterized protein n=1 Tax=Geodermatophilus dictyosporus TaxID=1523247 RepID=A0A1I5KWG0_9ACTN|nr:hypothetical protein SAMN05660464_1417 [Geodermatophilus dictyosporus]
MRVALVSVSVVGGVRPLQGPAASLRVVGRRGQGTAGGQVTGRGRWTEKTCAGSQYGSSST